DDGRTFTLHVGQTLPVDLTGSDTTRWGAPASTGPTVVATVTSTENPVTGSAAGTFRAVAPGTAQVRADKLTRCPPGQACPQLATLWQITVLVS
ncbi:MAG TPA: hypothetical protein VGR90_00585, partial [Acidimicrobiales bacterium]|nr:hypothetical protein [Acidimicrobiales bacterium]